VRVFTSIEFLQGSAKVYESKPVVANEVTAPDRKAVIFQIDLPLQALKPGFYVCQVNVVDDVAGNFAFSALADSGQRACAAEYDDDSCRQINSPSG